MATAPAKALRSPEEVGPVSPIIAEGLPASEAVDRAALLESLRQALANPEESIESIFTAVAAAAQVLTGADGIAVALRQKGRIVCRARSGDMGVIQRLQQYAIYDAEDRCVRRDSNSNRQQSDYGKYGAMAQCSQTVTDVEEDTFKGWPSPNFTRVLLDQMHIAKLAPRGMNGFFPRHAICDEFLNFFVEMRLNFFRQLVVELLSREHLPQPIHSSPGARTDRKSVV